MACRVRKHKICEAKKFIIIIIKINSTYVTSAPGNTAEDVSAWGVENFLKEQLKLSEILGARLKSKFNSCASFQVPVTEDNFSLIHNKGVRHGV